MNGTAKYNMRTITAGDVVEKIKFKIRKNEPNERLSDRERARRQRTTHDTGIYTHGARIVNNNFRNGDYFLTLTYRPKEHEKLFRRAAHLRKKSEYAAYDEQRLLIVAAALVLDNWIRRVQDKCKKLGIIFKYFAVTADGHKSDDGASGRIHHHVIVSGAAMEVCMEKWTAGFGRASPLWDKQKDRTPLVEYMIKQVKYYTHAKAYRPSRNLEPPIVKDHIVFTNEPPQPPRGATVQYRSEWRPGFPQYIRYIPKPRE